MKHEIARRLARTLLLTAVVAGALPAAIELQGQSTLPEPPAVSSAATAYIDAALKVMRENFLHRDKIDWPQLRRETLGQAAGAQTAVDTYPAIRFALARLGDHHSYLQLTPALTQDEASRKPKLANLAAMPTAEIRKPTFPFPSPFRARRVPEGAMVAGASKPIAQVVVPLFASPNRPDLDDFATKIQDVIASLETNAPCAWIVDLRGNGGGNVWAMLAGIGPLLGDGVFDGSIDHDLAKTDRFYQDGAAGERTSAQDSPYAKTTHAPVVLTSVPPVGVLIDRDTGSSGEGIAIAFRGRPETRFFGETTFGAASSTFPYPLSDGAQLYLVTGVMVDKNGNEYPTGITPDEEILSEATISTNDPVLRGGSTWLTSRPACQARRN